MPIYFITAEDMLEIVITWMNDKSVNLNRYISEENDKYISIDNTSGECWTGEFTTLQEAISWLLDK